MAHFSKTLLEVLGDKILVGDDCWEWTGAIQGQGYGHFKREGRWQRAHRAVYELLVGPIPDGLDLDHTCHTDDPTCAGGRYCLHRRCVRPDHLEPVTCKVNLRRGRRVGAQVAATHCPMGHPYSGDNLYIQMKKSGPGRQCRRCKKERRDRLRARSLGYPAQPTY